MASRPRPARHRFAPWCVRLSLGLGLIGCVALVNPKTGSTTCSFSGESSLCGLCIQSSCQPDVDACCSDPGCDGALANLDTCASSHGAACLALQDRAAPNAAAASLASCVATRCLGECQPFSGTAQTVCSEPDFGAGSVCTCELAGAGKGGNDFVCSSAAYNDTLCCAPEGWPATGIQCSCLVLSCNPSADGCFCMLANFTLDGGAPSQTSCSAARCCAQTNTCECGSRDCYTYERAVPACDLSAITCTTGEHKVDACSIFQP